MVAILKPAVRQFNSHLLFEPWKSKPARAHRLRCFPFWRACLKMPPAAKPAPKTCRYRASRQMTRWRSDLDCRPYR
ncbi:hypothetical protein [Thalassospira sp.]|uniref:hypothetical protein n=1 Tax=Thalassospira sp. TaxID=1912094 RepID=UPI003AA848EF